MCVCVCVFLYIYIDHVALFVFFFLGGGGGALEQRECRGDAVLCAAAAGGAAPGLREPLRGGRAAEAGPRQLPPRMATSSSRV